MESGGLPELETYSDYRKYLKDYYEASKRLHPYFSYRYFNRKAGIVSPTLYSEVAAGRRNLTEKTISDFVKGLKLSERQGRFFHALVRFNQAKTAPRKQEYLEQMRGLLPKVRQKVLPAQVYEYYSKWYHIALRELACIVDWQGDAARLAACLQPHIPLKAARESVEFLARAGLIEADGKGRYRQTWPHLTTQSEVTSLAVREGNRQMGKLGVEALDRFPPTQRDISSLTIGISEQEYSLVKAEIRYFKDRVRAILAGSDAPERVYNLNIQLFPLSGELGRAVLVPAGGRREEAP